MYCVSLSYSGFIYETVIDAQEKRRTYCVEVHELMQDMKGHIEPITGNWWNLSIKDIHNKETSILRT